MIRLSDDEFEQLDKLTAYFQERMPGMSFSRSDTVRCAIDRLEKTIEREESFKKRLRKLGD